MNRPSVTDMATPHIIAEMQAMKEQMDVMMNALKGRVSSDLDDLVHQTDSPFTVFVNSFPLPPMATTNNVQGDEPRPTALERQVQTLTTAMERLIK